MTKAQRLKVKIWFLKYTFPYSVQVERGLVGPFVTALVTVPGHPLASAPQHRKAGRCVAGWQPQGRLLPRARPKPETGAEPPSGV